MLWKLWYTNKYRQGYAPLYNVAQYQQFLVMNLYNAGVYTALSYFSML